MRVNSRLASTLGAKSECRASSGEEGLQHLAIKIGGSTTDNVHDPTRSHVVRAFVKRRSGEIPCSFLQLVTMAKDRHGGVPAAFGSHLGSASPHPIRSQHSLVQQLLVCISTSGVLSIGRVPFRLSETYY